MSRAGSAPTLRARGSGSTEVKDHRRPFDIDEVPPIPEVGEHATMTDEMTHEPGPPSLPRLFDVERTNDEITLTIRGSLDINSAPLLVEEVPRIVATKPRKVKVDLSELDLIDSSGVAALVQLYKGVRGNGGAMVFSGARGQPAVIFKIIAMPW